jgi:hypothetical protein
MLIAISVYILHFRISGAYHYILWWLAELAANKNVWALYETFLSQPVFVMVRFGMWDAMLKETKPNITKML